ncbi:hypothetical protein BCV70DRAFT_198346 [Testicularia cyperi]|uniref:Secreted protein n=1 Tax=Testicularia cyperi TaxID=1882483 RepID=A0A317XUN1_9BASI|nr:hypothetical protein BCV70DRAFT_198346 [Testicularia cyperi]
MKPSTVPTLIGIVVAMICTAVYAAPQPAPESKVEREQLVRRASFRCAVTKQPSGSWKVSTACPGVHLECCVPTHFQIDRRVGYVLDRGDCVESKDELPDSSKFTCY